MGFSSLEKASERPPWKHQSSWKAILVNHSKPVTLTVNVPRSKLFGDPMRQCTFQEHDMVSQQSTRDCYLASTSSLLSQSDISNPTKWHQQSRKAVSQEWGIFYSPLLSSPYPQLGLGLPDPPVSKDRCLSINPQSSPLRKVVSSFWSFRVPPRLSHSCYSDQQQPGAVHRLPQSPQQNSAFCYVPPPPFSTILLHP